MASDPVAVYRGFLDALNAHDLDAAERFVDPARYHEDCVGFTKGRVGWAEATESVRTVYAGFPDLAVEVVNLAADGDTVVMHGRVSGTNTGRLYGVPATKRRYQASYFDWVRVDDGRIVERVQQADVLGQMRQVYGRAFGTVAVGSLLVRL